MTLVEVPERLGDFRPQLAFRQTVIISSCVLRNGSLDASFGSGGTLTISIQGDDGAGALLIQSDGKIVAVGQLGEQRNWDNRYRPRALPGLVARARP